LPEEKAVSTSGLGVHRIRIIPQTARASDSTDRPMSPRRFGTYFILLFIRLIDRINYPWPNG
jgi:hypothetical protein